MDEPSSCAIDYLVSITRHKLRSREPLCNGGKLDASVLHDVRGGDNATERSLQCLMLQLNSLDRRHDRSFSWVRLSAGRFRCFLSFRYCAWYRFNGVGVIVAG